MEIIYNISHVSDREGKHNENPFLAFSVDDRVTITAQRHTEIKPLTQPFPFVCQELDPQGWSDYHTGFYGQAVSTSPAVATPSPTPAGCPGMPWFVCTAACTEKS